MKVIEYINTNDPKVVPKDNTDQDPANHDNECIQKKDIVIVNENHEQKNSHFNYNGNAQIYDIQRNEDKIKLSRLRLDDTLFRNNSEESTKEWRESVSQNTGENGEDQMTTKGIPNGTTTFGRESDPGFV